MSNSAAYFLIESFSQLIKMLTMYTRRPEQRDETPGAKQCATYLQTLHTICNITNSHPEFLPAHPPLQEGMIHD